VGDSFVFAGIELCDWGRQGGDGCVGVSLVLVSYFSRFQAMLGFAG